MNGSVREGSAAAHRLRGEGALRMRAGHSCPRGGNPRGFPGASSGRVTSGRRRVPLPSRLDARAIAVGVPMINGSITHRCLKTDVPLIFKDGVSKVAREPHASASKAAYQLVMFPFPHASFEVQQRSEIH
ncbi:unnamed protein product [Eretmochelys imbricata]